MAFKLDWKDIITIIVPIAGIALLWSNAGRKFKSGTYIKSSVDGRTYFVLNTPNKQKAADILAELNQRIEKLIEHLKSERSAGHIPLNMTRAVDRIIRLYNPDSLSENVYRQLDFTSYTFNKGQSIALCLTTRDNSEKNNEQFEPINRLIFVVLHEISHIGDDTVSDGARHTLQFWKIFSYIYNEAIKIGIHNYENYNHKPVDYCGMKIEATP